MTDSITKDRKMTCEERDEYYWLGVAYNKLMPWKDITIKARPMTDSIWDYYSDYIERKQICEAVGIRMEYTYDI